MWDLLLNEDETLIADSVREFLQREFPVERLRPGAPDCDLDKVRAGMLEMGWFGVGLPESVGGAELRLVEEMLIQRECGRFLVSPSVLATVLGAHVAHHAGDDALAGALVSGEAAAALATPSQPGAPADSESVYAFDWNGRDPLLCWNETGMGLFDAEALAQAKQEECLDEAVSLHAGLLALGRPRHWIPAEQAPLVQRAQVLLAANLVGLAGHACDLAVAYAREREQFGKPIGTFQAVKHRCADMGVRVRLAWYQTCLACLKVEAAAPDAPLQVASAKLVAAQAAHENGRAAIQVHGGIGFQSECDVHWFMKRAHVYDQVGGDVRVQARRVVAEPSPLW